MRVKLNYKTTIAYYEIDPKLKYLNKYQYNYYEYASCGYCNRSYYIIDTDKQIQYMRCTDDYDRE
jgi:hypothetical protein